MCLLSLRSDPKKANEDITVYKIVKYVEGANTYITPYTGTYIPDSAIEGRIPYNAIGDEEIEYDFYWNFFKVSKGFIHSFKKLAEASYYTSLGYNEMLFKCRIPKRVEYYDSFSECASKQIIFEKKIPKIFVKIMSLFYWPII